MKSASEKLFCLLAGLILSLSAISQTNNSENTFSIELDIPVIIDEVINQTELVDRDMRINRDITKEQFVIFVSGNVSKKYIKLQIYNKMTHEFKLMKP